RFGLGCDRADRWGTPEQPDAEEINRRLATPTAERIWYIRYAFKSGLSVEDVYQRTKIDRWFLHNIRDILAVEDRLRELQNPEDRERDPRRLAEVLLEA